MVLGISTEVRRSVLTSDLEETTWRVLCTKFAFGQRTQWVSNFASFWEADFFPMPKTWDFWVSAFQRVNSCTAWKTFVCTDHYEEDALSNWRRLQKWYMKNSDHLQTRTWTKVVSCGEEQADDVMWDTWVSW